MDLNQFSTVDIVLDKANDNIIQRQIISAGDRDGRSLTLQVTNEGSIGEVPGLTANLLWTNHSSGLSDLSAFSVVDRTTSIFKIEYPQNMLTPGKVTAQIQLLHNGKVTHSKKFEIIVLDIAGKLKGVLQTAEYTALVEALAKANEFEIEIAKKAGKEQVDALGNEIIVARGGSQTLGERLDKSDERTEIVETGVKKAMKSNFLKQQGLLVAHRGLMNLAPENSAIAFELAGKYGFWGIETDCHETTDGEFYLYHDADLSSQTNTTGKVYEMTSEELKDVVYTTAKGSTNYPNTPLCTLDEYLSIASKYNMFCFLEIGMVNNHQGILDKIKAHNMEGNVLINTNEYLVKTYRALDSFIPIGWVTWKKITDADINFCVENSVDMIGLAISDGSVSSNKNRDLVNKCHENGLIVSMYIINKYSDYNWCKNNFVDVITTDHIAGGK